MSASLVAHRFRTHKRLGAGSFGEIFVGSDVNTGRSARVLSVWGRVAPGRVSLFLMVKRARRSGRVGGAHPVLGVGDVVVETGGDEMRRAEACVCVGMGDVVCVSFQGAPHPRRASNCMFLFFASSTVDVLVARAFSSLRRWISTSPK